MIKCQICENEYDNFQKLSVHIKKHKISSKDYYLKYLCDFIPTCKICGSINVAFKDIRCGFNQTCSKICSKKLMVQRMKQTKLIRYGDEKYNNYDKAKDTCNKKYSTKFSLQLPEVRNKIKKTVNQKYGVNSYTSSADFQNKSIKSCLSKYGTKNAHQNQDVINKAKNTCIKKYGVDNVFKSEVIKQKIKDTFMRLYGVEYSMQCNSTHIKAMESQKNSYRLKKYQLNDGRTIRYQSLPELAYIKYCEDYNIWIDNGDKIPYLENNDKKHFYFVDFKIKENDKYRLIEIKGKTKWYYESLKNGTFLLKIKAAQHYSKINNYLPYKIIFENKIPK